MDVAIQLDDLIEAIIKGEAEQAVAIAEGLFRQGFSFESIIEDGLTGALRSLDVKCTNEEFNLLEIMLAGRAMMAVLEEVISPNLPSIQPIRDPNRTIVIGTIRGDIHDLGKHVVSTLLTARGFRVIDLGRDVDPVDFARMAVVEGARYIGISSLLTINIPFIRKIKSILREEGLDNIKVIAGGAAIQQARPEDLDVDYIARDVFDALRYLDGRF
ncbi:MAG: B12-binding domain-containing protein [Thermodesulfovibrionales bacterium]